MVASRNEPSSVARFSIVGLHKADQRTDTDSAIQQFSSLSRIIHPIALMMRASRAGQIDRLLEIDRLLAGAAAVGEIGGRFEAVDMPGLEAGGAIGAHGEVDGKDGLAGK